MPARILIVDDHQVVRARLRSLLEAHEGWEICGEAVNGREAVGKSLELRPDLLIIDLAMPVMNGLQASSEISKALPTMPILMYTQHTTTETNVQAGKVGVRRIVIKGEPVETLLQAIEELLLEANADVLPKAQQTPVDQNASSFRSPELPAGVEGEVNASVPQWSAISPAAAPAVQEGDESSNGKEKDKPDSRP